VVLLLLLE